MTAHDATAYLVIANAAAGSTERAAIGSAVGRLAEAAPTSLRWTEDSTELDTAIAGSGGQTLVVAGGDGSLHLFVNRLAAADALDRPVGLIPLGTGNDTARGCGLPLDPTEAAEAVVDGRPRRLALAEGPDGELMVNNAHSGLGVRAAERAAPLKPRLGPLAYPAGALLTGASHQPRDVQVAVDGQMIHTGPADAVLVALGPSAAGGAGRLDRPGPDQATLSVRVVASTGAAERIRLVGQLVGGTLNDANDVIAAEGRAVQVSGNSLGRGEIDGEFRDWPEGFGFEISPRRWNLLSP
ncbi:MAG: hypothetical protein KDB24_12695 [Microthrixaceae bacterium]|nr:hypothetical protein [Microthrixaceae bacterium]